MNTPKLLDEQEEQEHYRLIDESVERSAAVLKAIEERGKAIQRQNPHLPRPHPTHRWPAICREPSRGRSTAV
jgi:hypothetical protein